MSGLCVCGACVRVCGRHTLHTHLHIHWRSSSSGQMMWDTALGKVFLVIQTPLARGQVDSCTAINEEDAAICAGKLQGDCENHFSQCNWGSAASNTCTCTPATGTEATGAACTTNEQKCASCKKGYKLVGKLCVQCTAGFSQNSDVYIGSTCAQCLAGTSAAAGSEQCTTCVIGTHSSTAGSASCSACPPGQYQDQPGQSSCTSHTVCDPTLASGSARGVTNAEGTASVDRTCIHNNCAKLRATHAIDCKTGGNPTKCKADAVTNAKCIAIRELHKAAPCSCPAPAPAPPPSPP